MATQSERAVGIDALAAIVGPQNVLTGEGIPEELTHDEALTGVPTVPRAVVRPGTTEETAAVVTWASEQGVPVTARGSGTGLPGACIPQADGIVVSFERMADLVELDLANHVAVVQPGVPLPEPEDRKSGGGGQE